MLRHNRNNAYEQLETGVNGVLKTLKSAAAFFKEKEKEKIQEATTIVTNLKQKCQEANNYYSPKIFTSNNKPSQPAAATPEQEKVSTQTYTLRPGR